MNDYSLYHHGILGQKWGKRNGPPYPLRASDHSVSEKKAGWRKSLDKSTGKGDTKSNSDKKTHDLLRKEARLCVDLSMMMVAMELSMIV